MRSQKPWLLLSAPICLILDTAASSGNPATSLTALLLCERLTCLRSSTWSLSVKRRQIGPRPARCSGVRERSGATILGKWHPAEGHPEMGLSFSPLGLLASLSGEGY